jgi:glutamyl-tRNA reductase
VYAESDTEILSPGRQLVVVGYNHRTASLAVRSRFAVASDRLAEVTRAFTGLPGIAGCVLVVTCNRVEVYLEIRSEAEAEAAFVEVFGGGDIEGRKLLARSLMLRSNAAAAQHLFRVAAGLDSMVLGDAQILGQTKRAYKDACAFGTASPILHKVFHAAFRCAKQVRSETDIGGAHSVAGAGVSMLAEQLGGLRGRRFLLVGVGKMTRTAGARLCKAGAAHVTVTNRTDDRARELASQLCGEHAPWSQRLAAAARADAVVTCTGASEPIFALSDFASAVRGRSHLPLFVVDMAVPPDVARREDGRGGDGAGGSDDLVRVIDLEDIGAYQQRVQERRCLAIGDGAAIVDRHVDVFAKWLIDQRSGPRMKRLHDEIGGILERELERLPGNLDEVERERLTGFGEMLTRRFMAAYKRIEEDR